MKENSEEKIKLGLRENIFQFSLLVVVNAFIGSMVGLERSLIPLLAEDKFHLAAKTAVLSFIVVFGISKAFTNYFAGRLSNVYGRKPVLILGWLFSIPILPLLIWAESWNHVLWANLFLGISQGLSWSTAVVMKIDLVGPKKRGLAMGFNEFAGYFAVAVSSLLGGLIASKYGIHPYPFYLAIVYVAVGLFLSFFLVKETIEYSRLEQSLVKKEEKQTAKDGGSVKSWKESFFLKVTLKDKNLSSMVQAGFWNNFNDGVTWGLFPILFMATLKDLKTVSYVIAAYPASWGLCQLFTGGLSDRIGRKPLIYLGMMVQGLSISAIALWGNLYSYLAFSVAIGVGTAMVYPTLLAGIGDHTTPEKRAEAIGIYRLWRDMGYAFGAIVSGLIADFFGVSYALHLTAFFTFLSGVVVYRRLKG